MDERFAGLTPPGTGIHVARGELGQPRARLMKPRHDPAAVRLQLAPVLALPAGRDGDEREAEDDLDLLDPAPDVPVAPPRFHGRVPD
jgi:hypothetical protein